MLRPGDNAKLAPQQEQALLEKLRKEREDKAHATLQAEVQGISAKMVHMDMSDLNAEAKKISTSEKALSFAAKDAQIALVLNVLLRTCNPPAKDSPAKGKGGGGKKQSTGVKAAAAKVIEGVPPEGPQVRKVLKAHMSMLAEVTQSTAAGQLALLKALQSWLVSPQGANALVHAGKIVEVLYDADQAEEEVAMGYWKAIQEQLKREEAELAEASAAFTVLSADKAAAEEAVRQADGEKADSAWNVKQAEMTAQACRCGGNPSKEDEAAEKVALSALKKCVEYHTQTTKVAAARAKNLVEANAEFETGQRLLEQRRSRETTGVALFAKHAAPFFDWLAADDEDEEDEEDEGKGGGKGEGKGKDEIKYEANYEGKADAKGEKKGEAAVELN